MAKAYMLSQIDHLGGDPYWAEEKNHKELIECQSGQFIKCNLRFSNCETVGDFIKWQDEDNYLEIRYWDEKPTEEERITTPWTPYEVTSYSMVDGKQHFEIRYISEEEFLQLKGKYNLYEPENADTYRYTFRELYKCDNPKMDILRSRT